MTAPQAEGLSPEKIARLIRLHVSGATIRMPDDGYLSPGLGVVGADKAADAIFALCEEARRPLVEALAIFQRAEKFAFLNEPSDDNARGYDEALSLIKHLCEEARTALAASPPAGGGGEEYSSSRCFAPSQDEGAS